MKFDEFNDLQQAIDADEAAKQRDIGILSQLERTLREDHGCKSLREAKRLLKRLKLEQERGQQRLEREVEAFKRKYKNELADL